MITGKEDLLQSLMEAFLMEKGTHEFYSDAAGKAISAEARKVFVDLTEWEEQHMVYIQFLYLSIQGDRDIEGFEAFKRRAPAPIVEGGIPVNELEARIEKHRFIDDMGALIMALEIEGKAYSLYRSMSEKATDENARAVFREMMGQEQKHVEYLKEMRNRLAETS